jgi:hypothetical protein
MSTAIATSAPDYQYRNADAAPRSLVARLRTVLLWMVGFTVGFVLIEPAPYEFIIILATGVFAVTGLSLRASQVPLLVLLIILNAGFVISEMPVIELPDTLQWTAVSALLTMSTLFFAMVLAQDTERRLDILMNGYLACAIVTSIIAVAAFFKLFPGWENFILNLRAKATFKDPNVFAPFLVLPGLIVVMRIVSGGLRNIVFGSIMMMIIAAGLFLSFSRGAWGNFGASAAVMLGLVWITTRSVKQRIRIALFTIFGAAAVAAVIIALLSVRDVSALFEDRAALVKDYDSGHGGRFGRHIMGFMMVPEVPFGVGPLQFSKYFFADPHNSFLDAFMSGGWLAGSSWIALTLMTLVLGLRHAFVRTPWQMTYIAVYASFIGEVGESYIIDVPHWRHYFLIMGTIWGVMTARKQQQESVVGDR